MYGVLGVLLIVMGVYSALNDRLPWRRRIGHYKIELLPVADKEYESATAGMAYPMADCGPDPRRRIYRKNLKSQELEIIDPGKNLQFIGSTTTLHQNQDIKDQTMKSSSNPSVPGALRRFVRTYGSLSAISSPIKSFINETLVKMYMSKRKKKRRRNGPYVHYPNLKINTSLSETKISSPNLKSEYVRAIFPRTNGPKCPCEPEPEETTKIKFVLTPCECESDYEITDQTERNEACEETAVEETSPEENLCDECAMEQAECETPCTEETTEQCCLLDPIPKHTDDDSENRLCVVTQSSEDPQDEYPTYKTFPFSGCKHKKPRPKARHSQTTLEKSYEPDLRKIFNLSESTIGIKKPKPHTPNKKNDKNKSKKKYSKAKRKINRVVHLKRKDVTKKDTIMKIRQSELLKKRAFENILSRIKGRNGVEGNMAHGEVNNADVTENTTEAADESEGLGCSCSGNVVSNNETDSTETSQYTNYKKENFEEMFKKFLGESEKVTSEKWMATDTSNKDDTVTLIINMEDEVIAPPAATNQSLSKNPLSVAVQQMLADVKSKLTDAIGSTTTPEVEAETGLMTAERLKHLKSRKQTTHATSPKHGLLCTHCHKYNYIPLGSEYQVLNLKVVAETFPTTVSTTVTTTTVTTTVTTEVTTPTTCTEECSDEETRDLEEVTYGPKGLPVTDADYDLIISHIQCNFTDDTTTTVDLLKQLCENKYGPATSSINGSSSSHNQKETSKVSVADETQITSDIAGTQASRRKELQSTKEPLLKDLSETDDVTAVSWTTNDELSETFQTTHNTCKDDKTHIPMTTTRKMTTTNGGSVSTVNGHSKESKEASETVQTICFPVSDLKESETTTVRRKNLKTTCVTKRRTEGADTTRFTVKEKTKLTSKELDENDSSPRPCNCTKQLDTTTSQRSNTHDHSRHHTFFFHRHSTSSPRTSSTEGKSSSHKELPITEEEAIETVCDTVNGEESDDSDSEQTTNAKSTTSKPKKTTTSKPRESNKKPKKEKDKLQKPQKYKFYPPLSLYRTWLSPWAAVQIKNPAPRYKADQFNNDHHMIKFPRQPFSQKAETNDPNIWTTDSAIKLPSNLAKAKGVYVGAIILGNKNLPPGFYKLEDLKKLKNSGVSIPKFRGKKTVVGDEGIVYSIRRLLPHAEKRRHRGKNKNKWKILNNRTSSNSSGLAKLPDDRIVLDPTFIKKKNAS